MVTSGPLKSCFSEQGGHGVPFSATCLNGLGRSGVPARGEGCGEDDLVSRKGEIGGGDLLGESLTGLADSFPDASVDGFFSLVMLF